MFFISSRLGTYRATTLGQGGFNAQRVFLRELGARNTLFICDLLKAYGTCALGQGNFLGHKQICWQNGFKSFKRGKNLEIGSLSYIKSSRRATMIWGVIQQTAEKNMN